MFMLHSVEFDDLGSEIRCNFKCSTC